MTDLCKIMKDVLLQAARKSIEEKKEALILEATKKIRDYICKEADSIALQILKFYNIQQFGDKIIITVNKGGINEDKKRDAY